MDNTDNITSIVIMYSNGKAEFDEVLNVCIPLFKSFAHNTFDDSECISRMSRNLYRLVNSYDKRKGTPLQLIYRMCKNVHIDMYREKCRKGFIEYVDDSRYYFESKCCTEEESGFNILENSDDISDRLMDIVMNSKLRKSQKDRYIRGDDITINHKKNLEQLRESILEDEVLREYLGEDYAN